MRYLGQPYYPKRVKHSEAEFSRLLASLVDEMVAKGSKPVVEQVAALAGITGVPIECFCVRCAHESRARTFEDWTGAQRALVYIERQLLEKWLENGGLAQMPVPHVCLRCIPKLKASTVTVEPGPFSHLN